MLTLKQIIDNFFLQYEGIRINSDLATIWANDCAKKFISIDGNTELKAKIINITGNRGNLGKDYYRYAQVWFNFWDHREDKINFLRYVEKGIADKYGFKEKILKGCENKYEERCYLDLSKIQTTEYYKDPVLNAIHNQLTFISEMGLNINTDVSVNKYNKFIYATPDIDYETLEPIPCINNNQYTGKATYRISKDNLHIYTNYPEGIVFLIYFAIPMDEDGNVYIIDQPNVINTIYNYILYQNALKDLALSNNINEARFKINIFKTEYLRELLLAKNNIEKFDVNEFAKVYNSVVSKLLGRDINYNPFSFNG